MINISEDEKDLYRHSGTPKAVEVSFSDLSITLTNTDLVSESVSLTERIETEQNLGFKGCNSSVLEFDVANFRQDVRGQYLEATIQAEDGVIIPLFSGYVYDQSNQNHEDYITHITAYDALQPILTADVTAWYNALPFPITIKNLRDSFFTFVGMTQETVTLVNDAITVSKSITDAVITGATILKSICQLNGRFGQYGRDKVFHYRKLGVIAAGTYPGITTFPSGDTFPSEPNANEAILKDSYNSIDYQPYSTQKISKVGIIEQNGNVRGQSGSTTKDTFWITDNKLAWGLTNANGACANILEEVQGISFTPAQIDSSGLPYLECGDIVTANTRINVVNSYILERTLSGIQSLRDSFTGNIAEKRDPYTPSEQTEINANSSAISVTNSNVAAVTTRVGNLEATRVTTQQLNATNARVGTIEANYISASTVAANYATINSLNAVDAKFSNLSASNIKSGSMSGSRIQAGTLNGDRIIAGTISGDRIAAGTITADKISASSFSSMTLSVLSLKTSSLFVKNVSYSAKKITISGVNYFVLAQ